MDTLKNHNVDYYLCMVILSDYVNLLHSFNKSQYIPISVKQLILNFSKEKRRGIM